jgi:Flp pilus assembly protein TadD
MAVNVAGKYPPERKELQRTTATTEAHPTAVTGPAALTLAIQARAVPDAVCLAAPRVPCAATGRNRTAPATPAADEAVASPGMRPDLLVAAVVCLAIATGLAFEAQRERTLQRANDAGLRSDHGEAVRLARDAAKGPTRARALHTVALASLAGGEPAAALSAFRSAAEAAPRNWKVRRDWAIALLRSGDRRAAQVQYSRALALNPLLQAPDGFSR